MTIFRFIRPAHRSSVLDALLAEHRALTDRMADRLADEELNMVYRAKADFEARRAQPLPEGMDA